MASKTKRPRWPFPEHGKLTAHPRRHWCKWMGGKTHYFGPWRMPDPDDEFARAALRRYLAFARAKEESQPVEIPPSDLTLDIAVNHYLTARDKHVEQGNLSVAQFVMYQEAGKLLIENFGREKLVRDLGPADFDFLRSKLKGGPVYVGNQIQWIRSIFKWVSEFYGVLPRYGGQFNKPSKREVLRSRRVRVLFEPAEIQKLLKEAGPALRCFILLGINCGFGQTDCAKLAGSQIDWKKGVIAMDRPKTGVQRVCALWPETVKALKGYFRPSDALPHLFFITPAGEPWVKEHVHRDDAGRVDGVTLSDCIAQALTRLSKKIGVPTRGFYVLRHTFNTIAEGAGDSNALRAIMGHTFDGMNEFYLHLDRQPEFMARLRGIADHLHKWLYGK